jgi:hypothetical protein
MRRAASFLTFCLLFASGASTLQAQDAWVLPRTPDGHPDLSGNWTNATLTPFERRRGQGPVLTPEEAADREAREAAAMQDGAAPSDPERAVLEAGGNIGSYNSVFWSRGDRVAVVNGEARTSLLTIPADGRIPPLTAAGERRMAEYRAFVGQFGEADNPENRPNVERCVLSRSLAGPPMTPNQVYNNNYTIVQTADYVMIMAEMINDVRIIPLGESRKPSPNVRLWMGSSWGRWEGDTLVVETTNLHPGMVFHFQPPPSAELVVTERFTRVDEETILYQFLVEDPTTYSEPWGGDIPFKRFPQNLYEYGCHEANYALENILRGARYQESSAAGR